MEHRWGNRKAIDVPVRFMALPATIGTGRIVNISMTGAFLETRAQLRPMSLLYVEMIHLPPDSGPRRRLSASVVRRTDAGVGIEWCEPASKSPLYASLRSAARASADSNSYGYRFDFID